MPRRSGAGDSRARGSIETRANGSLRVSVYAGIDPVTGRRHYLREAVPAGPRAWREAEDVKNRLLAEVAAKRNPRTSATVDQLLERYLDQFSGSPTTLDLYRTHVRNHISPVLGHLRVGQLDAETLDSFYGELLRCRTRGAGRRTIDHRVSAPHDCDERCTPHQCKPLAPTTVRHIQRRPLVLCRAGRRPHPRLHRARGRHPQGSGGGHRRGHPATALELAQHLRPL